LFLGILFFILISLVVLQKDASLFANGGSPLVIASQGIQYPLASVADPHPHGSA
jgi:hypothetical protein